jgi:hypothetical protein
MNGVNQSIPPSVPSIPPNLKPKPPSNSITHLTESPNNPHKPPNHQQENVPQTLQLPTRTAHHLIPNKNNNNTSKHHLQSRDVVDKVAEDLRWVERSFGGGGGGGVWDALRRAGPVTPAHVRAGQEGDCEADEDADDDAECCGAVAAHFVHGFDVGGHTCLRVGALVGGSKDPDVAMRFFLFRREERSCMSLSCCGSAGDDALLGWLAVLPSASLDG